MCARRWPISASTSKPRATLGIRIYKVGLTWPLEAEGARRFAEGLEDVLVVEEKRGFIEDQLVRILYNMHATDRPTVVGKTDERGAPLLPSAGEIGPTMVAQRRDRRACARLGRRQPARWHSAWRGSNPSSSPPRSPLAKTQRTPYLLLRLPAQHIDQACPTAAARMAGIGCHVMAL